MFLINYFSKKENIKAPPTITYPYNSPDPGGDYADPMDFNRWIRDIPKEELILITENYQDTTREESGYYIAGNIIVSYASSSGYI